MRFADGMRFSNEWKAPTCSRLAKQDLAPQGRVENGWCMVYEKSVGLKRRNSFLFLVPEHRTARS